MKGICLNYLRAKELDTLFDIDARVREERLGGRTDVSTLTANHPLLQYAAHYVFPHAAQAEQHGISQDGFRAYLCGNTEACFERWKFLHDMIYDFFFNAYGSYQGDGARPIHVFAEHGILSKEIAEKEANIDIEGGVYNSALATACKQGHEDTVELLLSLGADPIGRRFLRGVNHKDGMPAFASAISYQHLPILRRLMNHPRSSLTLSDRLSLVHFIGTDSRPHSKAMLDLLIPEATFPDSVDEIVCSLVPWCTPETLSFLLDKSRESILHEEKFWCDIVSSEGDTMSKLRILLDRGGTIKITGTLLCHCRSKPAKIITLLLSEGFEVETTDDLMTDDLMNAICSLEESSHTVRAFESAGSQFKVFTGEQLLQVLRYGSAESAAFFLQRNDYNVSTDEILISALGNYDHGLEVSRLVLGNLDPDSISEQTIIAALENHKVGGDLVRLLHSRRSDLIFSEAVLTVAVKREFSPDVVEFILANYESITISEMVFTAAICTRNREDRSGTTIELLLLHDPDIEVRESTVIKAIRSDYRPRSILTTFCKHNKSLFCTEDVITAAVTSSKHETLEIILQQDRSTKISSTMIMMAMKATEGAAKISVMLHHDHTLVIEEEHLIAAALNSDQPSLIFEILQARGKLDIANPASESLSIGTAKRRKVSHELPSRISNGIIDAALSNPDEEARRPLLRLFLEWGIITENDYRTGISYPINRSHPTSTVTSPSVSETSSDL